MVANMSHSLRHFLARQPPGSQFTGTAYCVVPSSRPENSNPVIVKGITIASHCTMIVIDDHPYFLELCLALAPGGQPVVIRPHTTLSGVFVLRAGKEDLASIRVAAPPTEAATPAA